jgi:hypothetical protein
MARGKHTTATFWRQHFAAQAAGDINTASYCRQQGIRSSQWYFWRKKLRAADDSPSGITLVPVKVEPTLSMAPDIRVTLPNGIAVTFTQVESAERLLQTLYCLGSS